MQWDHLWRNARLATMQGDGLGIIERGAVAVTGGRIAWVGDDAAIPAGNGPESDCEGRLLTPGLIDCHTHLVYAGSRAGEFARRLEGASYADIAASGGGIVSTVAATRAASEAELLVQSLPRLDTLIAHGVTTVEIKSGYGLDLESETKMLRVARQLAMLRSIAVKTTFLGAHAVPPGRSRAEYITEVIEQMLPAIAASGLADAVDAFCEGIAFSTAEVARLFDAAAALGLPVKLHAEQLSALGGATLAAQHHALSADHLEWATQADVAAMAAAGTVAVLLPGAFYFLRESRVPPVAALREAGVPIALATDCNPGTSPLTSPLLAMNMAATCFRLTVAECLRGFTVNGALALGLADRGVLAAGRRADLAIWNVPDPAELVQQMGFNPLWKRLQSGA